MTASCHAHKASAASCADGQLTSHARPQPCARPILLAIVPRLLPPPTTAPAHLDSAVEGRQLALQVVCVRPCLINIQVVQDQVQGGIVQPGAVFYLAGLHRWSIDVGLRAAPRRGVQPVPQRWQCGWCRGHMLVHRASPASPAAVVGPAFCLPSHWPQQAGLLPAATRAPGPSGQCRCTTPQQPLPTAAGTAHISASAMYSGCHTPRSKAGTMPRKLTYPLRLAACALSGEPAVVARPAVAPQWQGCHGVPVQAGPLSVSVLA